MKKAEARAIILARNNINHQLDRLLAKLSPEDREWAQAYYVGHIRALINGRGYGSAPIEQAEEKLEH